MVSHKHKCIFIHVPKTGGQSVEYAFLNDLGLDWPSRKPLILMENQDAKNGPPRLAHLTVEEYVSKHYLSQEVFDNYFKFSFVRHPETRLLSFYKFYGYDHYMALDRFIEKELNQLMKRRHWFLRPQVDFIYKNGESLVDFLGKFENFQSDFEKVKEKLGRLDLHLPHVNKSKSKSLADISKRIWKELKRNPFYLGKVNPAMFFGFAKNSGISNRSLETIYSIYEPDYKAFDYKKGILNSRD